MSALGASRPRRAGLIGAGIVVAWAVAATALPDGLPFGIVLLGIVLGSLSALTALGLVLVWRGSRVINFAQAEIGGLAAAVAVVMVAGYRMPYFLALLAGLAPGLRSNCSLMTLSASSVNSRSGRSLMSAIDTDGFWSLLFFEMMGG